MWKIWKRYLYTKYRSYRTCTVWQARNGILNAKIDIYIFVLATESFSETWIGNNTCITTRYIMMFAFTANIFETIEITHSEYVSSLAATCTKHLLSIYCIFTSEESVYTESFSLLEFSYHREYFLWKKLQDCMEK